MSTEAGSHQPARRLGLGSFALAAVLLIAEIVAIAIGNSGAWPVATAIAWAVIVLTGLAFLLGLVAVILHRGRAWGIAAMALSLVVNPLVQVWLLGLVGNS